VKSNRRLSIRIDDPNTVGRGSGGVGRRRLGTTSWEVPERLGFGRRARESAVGIAVGERLGGVEKQDFREGMKK
jgi:hypothetical protein